MDRKRYLKAQDILRFCTSEQLDMYVRYFLRASFPSEALQPDDQQILRELPKPILHRMLSEHCIILTGAGLSTACGFPTWRNDNGKRITSALPSREMCLSAVPSQAHRVLAACAWLNPQLVWIDQNIDGLGARLCPPLAVAEIHGTAYDVNRPTVRISGKTSCAPEETLPIWLVGRVAKSFSQATIIVCIGTSLDPGLTLTSMVNAARCHATFVIVGPGKTSLDLHANYRLHITAEAWAAQILRDSALIRYIMQNKIKHYPLLQAQEYMCHIAEQGVDCAIEDALELSLADKEALKPVQWQRIE